MADNGIGRAGRMGWLHGSRGESAAVDAALPVVLHTDSSLRRNHRTLKLALIGTHGVGKTTLAYEICSLLKKADQNVELVTEVARKHGLKASFKRS